MNEALVPSDVQALERLMGEYGDSVLRMCHMLLRDKELARDAAQESFLKAYRAINTLRDREAEKAWLMRIAVNTCRDMQRTGWWRMVDRRMTPEDLPRQGDDIPDPTLLNEVMSLPLKYRQVVVLHYYQGMQLEEIARALNKPAGTIRSQMKRAKEKLHDRLKGWYDDE